MLTKLTNWMLCRIDKVLHFVIVAVLTLSFVACLMPLGFKNCILGTLALDTIFIVGKEAWDKFHPPHVAEWDDVFAGYLGSALVILAVFIGRTMP